MKNKTTNYGNDRETIISIWRSNQKKFPKNEDDMVNFRPSQTGTKMSNRNKSFQLEKMRMNLMLEDLESKDVKKNKRINISLTLLGIVVILSLIALLIWCISQTYFSTFYLAG